MLMITEISPTSINKYFNREFIIVATSVSLVRVRNGSHTTVYCESYNHTPECSPKVHTRAMMLLASKSKIQDYVVKVQERCKESF